MLPEPEPLFVPLEPLSLEQPAAIKHDTAKIKHRINAAVFFIIHLIDVKITAPNNLRTVILCVEIFEL